MSVLSHIVNIETRYSETDQMGIIYQSHYVVWFDIARTAWLKACGHDYKEIEEQGIYIPIIKLNIEYKVPAVFGDIISVTTKVKREGRIKLFFEYHCHNQRGDYLTYGESLHAFMNKEKKPVKLPDLILKLFA